MDNRIILYGLIAAIVLQLSVLLIEYTGAMYPLWTGQEIILRTRPIDPRSLFRGNYARLNYDISLVPRSEISSNNVRSNEIIYVKLKENEEGIYEYDGVSPARPESGVFIRGRVRWDANRIRIRYGIEAFFARKEKALALERELRYGGLATVMVAGNGKATLKDVSPGN